MKNPKLIWLWRWNGPIAIIGMIAVVVALLLPAIQQAREAARRTQSKNNFKEIGLALHNYADTYQMLPPGGVFNAEGLPFHGWMTAITPYLNASPWYNEVNFNIPWDHPDQIHHFQPGYGPTFLNPSITFCCGDDGLIRTHYAGSDLVFYHNSSTRFTDLTSGTSQTFLAGDASGHFEPFGYSYNWRSAALGVNSHPSGFGSSVRNITQMLMADGSVGEFRHKADKVVFATFRGVNSKCEERHCDVSKPSEPYRVSLPIVCLWAEPRTCASLMGVQDESKELVRAWFLNGGRTGHEKTSSRLDRQAELLKPFKSLRELNIWNALSDKGLQALEELPNLETVRLSGRSYTNRGFEILSRCKHLKHLELSATNLGDAGWEALAKAPQLESISVKYYWQDNVRFSAQSVVAFMDQNPQCDVTISRGRIIRTDTIRELAETGKPWPPYRDDK